MECHNPTTPYHLGDKNGSLRNVCLMTPNDRRDQRRWMKLNLWRTWAFLVRKFTPNLRWLKLYLILNVCLSGRIWPILAAHRRSIWRIDQLLQAIWTDPGWDRLHEPSSQTRINSKHLLFLPNGEDIFDLLKQIWTIRNLRILVLKGPDWAPLGDAEDSFITMLNNSPDLEVYHLAIQGLLAFSNSNCRSWRFPTMILL